MTDDRAPPTTAAGFDLSHWQAVHVALDEALECEGPARQGFLADLAATRPHIHREVVRLLDRLERANAVAPKDGAGLPIGPLTDAPTSVSDAGAPFRQLLSEALTEAEVERVPEPKSGDLCGPWRLIELIGSGGMGEVWLAERADGLFKARVALKFLKADSNSARFMSRFAQERELLARLNHPGIARMLDAGVKDGFPYLVLEHVAGQRLLDYVTEHAPRVRERIELIRQVGEALIHAHSQLVVHRDIKPSNILVTPDGRIKLLDFGVAGLLNEADPRSITESPATRLSGRGLTVEYAAPEQISGTATGVASDIYSVAALAYHLCAGRRAHLAERGNRVALEHEVLHVEPMRVSVAARTPPPFDAPDLIAPPADPESLVGDIDAILAQGMRRDPQARYATMSDLVEDIDRWLRHLPITARKEDRRYRTRLWLRRNWLPTTLASGLVLALAIGLAVSLWQAERARAEAWRASKAASFLIEMLNGADPDVHGGQWPTVLALIEQARAEVPVRFRDDPTVELQISHHLATTLRRLSRFNDALPLARRTVELAERTLGKDAPLTRQSMVLLADILYWVDETRDGLPLLERALAAGPAAPTERWWREAILLRANMLGELRRFPESYAEFDRYMSLIAGLPDRAWLTAEAEVDRALIQGREGRIRSAYELHLKYRPQFEQPPQHARRIALNALMNLAHFQLRLGESEGVEATLNGIIGAWDKLAGRRNRHSMEALEELGLYHLRFGSAERALEAYAERAVRAAEMTPVDSPTVARSALDEVEVKIKRALIDPVQAAAAVRAVEARLAAESRLNAAARAQLTARLVSMYVAAGDLRSAQGLWLSQSGPTAEPTDPRTFARRTVTDAELKAAGNDFTAACRAMSTLIASPALSSEEYDGALRHLRAALYCTLAKSDQAAALRAEADRRIPPGVPSDHRLRRISRYIAILAERNMSPDEARATAAALLGLPERNVVHVSLPGLWL
jgi:serine/threonine-protein kinase